MRTDDDVRRMLERRATDVDPAPDAWDNIAARLGEEPVGAGGGRRPGLWLFAAAALAVVGLVAGAVLMARQDDGERIQVGPAGEGASTSTTSTTLVAEDEVISSPELAGVHAIAGVNDDGEFCVQLRRVEESFDPSVCGLGGSGLDDAPIVGGFGGLSIEGEKFFYGLFEPPGAELSFEFVEGAPGDVTVVTSEGPGFRVFVARLDVASLLAVILLDASGNEAWRNGEQPGPALTADSRVTINGIGPVRVGMTLAEAGAAGGVPITLDGVFTDPECQYAWPESGPDGVAFMVSQGRIVRIDVMSEDVLTLSGAHVGMTDQEIMALYPGQIEVSPHPYLGEDGSYLTYVPNDPGDDQYRIVFEANGNIVTDYRSGQLPQVEYVEGCA